jgi:magnesium-transporting ATPase (P-type)
MSTTLCYGLAVSICPSSLTYTEPVKASIVPASKNVSMLESNNMLLMGCNIVEGEGTGMVIASGQSNQLSKIATQAGGDAPMTSLQVEIYRWVPISEVPCSIVACDVP